MVGFTEAVKLFFRRYADFRGRSTRAEYWWWTLFFWGLVILVLSLMTAVDPHWSEADTMSPLATALLGAFGVFVLAIIVPSLALTVRRFHDVGLSGWWLLALTVLSVIPLLGLLASLAVFVITVLPSKPAVLKWGPPRHGPVLPIPGELPGGGWTRQD